MTPSKDTSAVTAVDRLLAEAIRCDEEAHGAPSAAEESPAVAQARALAGPFEAKVVARAKALPSAEPIATELARVKKKGWKKMK